MTKRTGVILIALSVAALAALFIFIDASPTIDEPLKKDVEVLAEAGFESVYSIPVEEGVRIVIMVEKSE